MIAHTSDIEIEKEDKSNIFTLKRTWYPLRGYSNHVTTYIEFDDLTNLVQVIQVNQGWNGTGNKTLAFMHLRDDEFQSLLNVTKRIKTVEDFDVLLEKVFEVEKRVDEQIDEKFNKIIDELIELYGKTKLREILEDREQVKEILTTYALEGE